MSNARLAITQTSTLSVNANNDLFLDTFGNIVIAFDVQAVLQNCAHVAKVRLGEIVLAVNEGIPFFETVWNGTPNFQQFEAALRQAFYSVTGVLEVVSLIVSQVAAANGKLNTLAYTAVIRTVYGSGGING